MNPYKAYEVSNLGINSRIDWFLILHSFGIFLLAVVPLYLLQIDFDSWQDTWKNTLLALSITLLPWFFGASYLALRTSKQWAVNGIIFSIAAGFVTFLIGAANNYQEFPELDTILLIEMSGPFCISTVVTMIIMSITKGVLWLIRALNRHRSSV